MTPSPSHNAFQHWGTQKKEVAQCCSLPSTPKDIKGLLTEFCSRKEETLDGEWQALKGGVPEPEPEPGKENERKDDSHI